MRHRSRCDQTLPRSKAVRIIPTSAVRMMEGNLKRRCLGLGFVGGGAPRTGPNKEQQIRTGTRLGEATIVKSARKDSKRRQYEDSRMKIPQKIWGC